MTVEKVEWLRTENQDFKFENNSIGRIKKEVWDADELLLDKWLKNDFEIPSESEIGKPYCYIQTTPRHHLNERRHKNDIVFLPIGSSECHGDALPTGHDVFQITQMLEGVRRFTKKQNREVNLAWPVTYGGHPYHHLGMPGTIIIPHNVLMEHIMAVMLGLWNDGFRKIILVNNHGHQWTLAAAVQEFSKRYQLPGIFQVFDFPAVCRDFFIPNSGKEDQWLEPFTHAGESEGSLGLLLFPEMIDMKYSEDGTPKSLFKKGWFDNSLTDYGRPHQWFEGEGHNAIEMSATRNGVVGIQSLSDTKKAKRPVVAMCKLMVELIDNILEMYPSGVVPPVEATTLRTAQEMEPYLKEPMSEGWKSVYGLPSCGPF